MCFVMQTWDARLLMERSLAVKCPDISTHLVGVKKVQQVLAQPGVLERFFPEEPGVVEQIRATFAGLYTLDMVSRDRGDAALVRVPFECRLFQRTQTNITESLLKGFVHFPVQLS